MFAATTKAVVKTLGAERDLIPNKNVNNKIEMLTLVKVHKTLFKTNYYIINKTLLDLVGAADVSPEYTEEVLMKDFTNLKFIHAGGCAGANVKAAGDVQVAAGMTTMDTASTFTLKKKTVDPWQLLMICIDKKIDKNLVDDLNLKEDEKLTFVDQIVYNTNPVTFVGINQLATSVSATVKMFFKSSLSGIKKEETSFTLPEENTFAYSLMDVKTDGGTLRIPPKQVKYEDIVTRPGVGKGDDSCEILQEVNKELEMKEYTLQQLADLPESTRRDLQKTLRELLDDRDALALLEQRLDQGTTGESDRARSLQMYAVCLLISAIDTLPDDVSALLTSCSPDALRVLNQLVDSLKEDAETKLPESLPPPLQEEGELRWVAELLCSSGDALTELSDQWDRPDLTLAELLANLWVVIRGLSLMQP